MSQSEVYMCPGCGEVIRAEGRRREEITCSGCGFQLGKEPDDELSPQPGTLRDSPLARAAGGSMVMRNVTRSGKGGPLPGVKRTDDPVKAKLPEARPLTEEDLGPGVETPDPNQLDEVILPDGTRQVKRRKKRRKERNKALYIFLGIWLLVAGVLIAFFLSPKLKEQETDRGMAEVSEEEKTRKRRENLFLKKHSVAAIAAFKEYVEDQTERGKMQKIDYSSELAANFGRFYEHATKIQPLPGITRKSIRVVEFARGQVPPGIEVVWETPEGGEIESLSVYNGRDWVLDWEHMVRYGSDSWSLFRLGAGKKEGVFRVYVRKKSLSDTENWELVFYGPPTQGEPTVGSIYDGASSDVVVPAKSELGEQFESLWQDFKAGYRVYDSKFPDGDPHGLMRITVRLAWETDEDGERTLHLREIMEPSWYGQRVQETFRAHPPVRETLNTEDVFQKLVDED